MKVSILQLYSTSHFLTVTRSFRNAIKPQRQTTITFETIYCSGSIGR